MGARVRPDPGPARTSCSSIWMLVQDQHHCSRVSKTSTYRMSAASRMLPKQPLKNFAPALAESTVSVELAGEAKRAITATPKALEPWAYGKRRSGHEAMLQSDHDEPPRRGLNEGALVAWDPEGKPVGEETKSKKACNASKSNHAQRRPPARET